MDLYVRTEFDGKDHLQVTEVFYYDELGDERIHARATGVCENLTTCSDMPERYETLGAMVLVNLKHAGISAEHVYMEDEV